MKRRISEIVEETEEYFGFPPGTIIGKGRTKDVANARHIACAVAASQGHSSPAIGRAMGGRDHTTVLNSIMRAKALAGTDPAFKDAMDAIGRRNTFVVEALMLRTLRTAAKLRLRNSAKPCSVMTKQSER